MKKIGCVQHDCAECRRRINLVDELIADLKNLGFNDPDQAVNGGDAVEYLCKLYVDLKRMRRAQRRKK